MAFAKTTDEYEAIGTSSSEFIRNREAWTSARASKFGVLAELSDSALEEFESSMGFGKETGCLLRANCNKISQELGDNIYKFFELFGADKTIMGKFYPFKCGSD